MKTSWIQFFFGLLKHWPCLSCLLLQCFHSIPYILLAGILCFTTHPLGIASTLYPFLYHSHSLYSVILSNSSTLTQLTKSPLWGIVCLLLWHKMKARIKQNEQNSSAERNLCDKAIASSRGGNKERKKETKIKMKTVLHLWPGFIRVGTEICWFYIDTYIYKNSWKCRLHKLAYTLSTF
jgi:hypothetical protein